MSPLPQIILILFTTMLFSACGEDEYVYPDMLTEMACLQTDAQGYGHQLITDNGKTWAIPQNQQPNKLTADSLYRVISKFAPHDNGEISVYALQSVKAPLPKVASEFPVIYTDPISIQSIWQSGEYLNLILQVMVKDQEHEFGFIDNGITTDANGVQTLSLTLFHNRNNDVEGFYRKVYLSVPLWQYKEILNQGDVIEFHLNTYEEGMTHRIYTY